MGVGARTTPSRGKAFGYYAQRTGARGSVKFYRRAAVICHPYTGSRAQLHKRGRIVLLHFAGQMPLAGIAWQAVHHIVALAKLGYEVWYVEDSGAAPYDPRIESVATSGDYNIAYLRQVMERFGLGERWAYWCGLDDTWHGLT